MQLARGLGGRTNFLGRRVLVFFGVVLGLSFVLLLIVFHSLLVPLKAVIMNVLAMTATYGVVVAVFQWGWGGHLLRIAGAPIEPFISMILFAIVSGLSMDYEVFLLSRVREEYARTNDAVESVADGLAATDSGDHGGWRHHGGRVRLVRPRGRPRPQDVRSEPGRRGAARCHLDPHADGPGHHGPARLQELVDPWLARPSPARREVEGHTAAHPPSRRSRPDRAADVRR
jgi:MMPL family